MPRRIVSLAQAPFWPAMAVLAIVWLAMLLIGGSGLDRAVLVGGYSGERAWELPAILITRLGDWQALIAFTFFGAALLIARRRARTALFLIGVTLAGRALVGLQKVTVGRLRPDENPHLVDVETLSFPSGHAANATIVYLALALILTRPGEGRAWAVAAALALALLIGASRVMLGVHWPSDVVGGWAFGLMWTVAAFRWIGPKVEGHRREGGT